VKRPLLFGSSDLWIERFHRFLHQQGFSANTPGYFLNFVDKKEIFIQDCLFAGYSNSELPTLVWAALEFHKRKEVFWTNS
jgi:hypothetical protein